MTNKEIIDYLASTGLYENTEGDMYYEKRMLDENKTVPIRDLVERFVGVDKEFNGESWNIMQILKNIDMIIPVEDRKCGNCSRRKFYQVGYKDGLKESEKELREYKDKVEKIISKNRPIDKNQTYFSDCYVKRGT